MKSKNTKQTGPYQSHTKWGLFVLLAGSLGFTLSMNPDHFNNIARNESGLSGVFDLAATAPPAQAPAAAKPAQAATPAAAKPTEAEKAKADQLSKIRAVLANAKVDKLDDVMKTTSDLMDKNVPVLSAVYASLQSAGVSADDSNKLTVAVKNSISPSQDESVSQGKPMTSAELDTHIADIVKRAMKDNAQLPASAQPPANPGTPDQQVQAAKQAAANRPNNPGSEFGSSSGRSSTQTTSLPPDQKIQNIQKIYLMSDRTNAGCLVSVDQEDGQTIGRSESLEGKTCPLDKKFKFNASIDDISAISKIANNVFRDKVNKNEKEDGEREEDRAKLTAAKDAWEKAQKRCKGKDMDLEDKMDCVQDNFTELSEKLDDSNPSKALLKKVYNSTVAPLLKAAMIKPIVTFDRFGRVIVNQDPISGNLMANNLIDSLSDAGNASSIVADLQRKSMEGLRTQATMAQSLYSTAKNEQKNPRTFQVGVYREAAANTFMNQIASVWPDQDLSALINSVTTGANYTPGLSGLTSIPQDMADARIRAQSQYRGYNVPAPATFGSRSTFSGQQPPNQNMSQIMNNQNLMNQNLALPARGMTRVSGIYTPELTIP